MSFYLFKLEESVTFLYLGFRYSALIYCFPFAYILFIHVSLDDPSLEISTNSFVFNIGMFRLDSAQGKLIQPPPAAIHTNFCHATPVLNAPVCLRNSSGPGGGTFSKHIKLLFVILVSWKHRASVCRIGRSH